MAEEYKRPGWYPDPEGKPGERWWNGSSWSETSRGGAARVAPPEPARPSVVYSASNPAPQRPDPYAAPASIPTRSTFSIDTRSNRPALIGFILGLVSLFAINLAGPVAVGFSIAGIAKARELKAAGTPGSTLVLAAIGLVAGLVATGLLVVTIVAFIASFSFSYSS